MRSNYWIAKRLCWIGVTSLALASAGFAQSNISVYASGLKGPRGLKFGPDGALYVAEAGQRWDHFLCEP